MSNETSTGQTAEDTFEAKVSRFEKQVVALENDKGASPLELAQVLEEFASLLRTKQTRLLDAANLAARAKAIRFKNRLPGNPQPTVAKKTETEHVTPEQAEKEPQKQDPKPAFKNCPFCAEEIKQEAIICRYCKMNLNEFSPPGRLTDTTLCNNCNGEIKKEALICKHCKRKVTAQPAQSEAARKGTALGTIAVMLGFFGIFIAPHYAVAGIICLCLLLSGLGFVQGERSICTLGLILSLILVLRFAVTQAAIDQDLAEANKLQRQVIRDMKQKGYY